MTPPAPAVALNARFLQQEVTGVQRYGREMLSRLSHFLDPVRPAAPRSAVGGHLWEQFTLPSLCRGRLLWSPCNTGPLSVRAQVVTIHDAATLEHPEWFSRKFALWYRFLLPRLARRVRRILTVSEFSRQRLAELLRISPERIAVIPNGVDARFGPALADELPWFLHGERLTRPYLLYAGSLEPRKNVARLFEAWKQVGWKDGDLVVVGAAGTVFRDSVSGAPPAGVRLWGRATDYELCALCTGATGFVFPSLYEGFGLPPLEAMACGCPALVSNTSSLPEVCGPAFDPATGHGNALYLDPLDVESIADGMRRLIGLSSEDHARLSKNGRAQAARFTWDRSVAQVRQVLEEASRADE